MATEGDQRSKWSSYAPLALKLDSAPGSSSAPILSYRHDWEIADQVTVSIGGDLHAARRPFRPTIGCKLSSDGDWALEISNREAVMLTPDMDLAKPLVSLLNNRFRKSEESGKFSFSLPINVRVGTEWSEGSSQHICDVGVKNKYVIGMFLASSLIFQTPKSVHVKKKELTGVKLNVGGSIPIGLGVVVDANLSREGQRLVVSFTDVPTPVIRTSEKLKRSCS